MNAEMKKWFIAERGKALALVLLTRRDDLLVKETKEENGLDYTVHIKTPDNLGDQPFGVYVASGMTPVTLDGASKQLQPVMEKVQSIGRFAFPVCVFYFTVKDDEGYHAWAYEPFVTPEGTLKLLLPAEARCRKLNNESLAEIVSAVQRWYEGFYSTRTTSGSNSYQEPISEG
ncbi:MAG: hypothetical protein L0Z62_29925 [Gemmataceae bacterium]|nr:hypothetical protein [Gemmataceae bacterium]